MAIVLGQIWVTTLDGWIVRHLGFLTLDANYQHQRYVLGLAPYSIQLWKTTKYIAFLLAGMALFLRSFLYEKRLWAESKNLIFLPISPNATFTAFSAYRFIITLVVPV
jgi:hypothetical protein